MRIQVLGNGARPIVLALALALAAAGAACGGERDGTSADTAATGAPSSTADTSADAAFLAGMIGHHQGLISMAEVTMESGTGSARADAEALHHKQSAERDRMSELLSTRYGTMITPAADEKSRMMADSLKKLSGGAHNAAFYEMTIRHHQDGVAMIGRMLGDLKDPEVRDMAAKMKADQTAEIAEFRGKAGSSRS